MSSLQPSRVVLPAATDQRTNRVVGIASFSSDAPGGGTAEANGSPSTTAIIANSGGGPFGEGVGGAVGAGTVAFVGGSTGAWIGAVLSLRSHPTSASAIA